MLVTYSLPSASRRKHKTTLLAPPHFGLARINAIIMAGHHGDFVAKRVNVGLKACVTTSWTALQVGDAPQKDRRHIKIQVKSAPGVAIVLGYSAKNLDGTYTDPTIGVKEGAVVAGNTTVIEPIGDVVTVYGRLVLKKGATQTSSNVSVTEYS